MADKDLFIGYCHGAFVDSAFHDSLTRLLAKDRFHRVLDVAAAESGPYLTDNRNAVAELFLKSSARWMLQLDADMAFGPDLPARLLRHATPTRVVGGLAFAYNGLIRDAKPVMFDEAGERITAWTPGALVPVGFTGGACLLIHRNVFETISRNGNAPWFQNSPGNQDQDQTFCANVRFNGMSVAVDTSTVVGHCKRIVVTDADYAQPEAG